MIAGFKDETTRDIFDGTNSKAARRVPVDVWSVARRKLDSLNGATSLKDLSSPPGNRLEAFKGRLAGQHSIRVNDQFRVVFTFELGQAINVWITDDH